MRENKMYTGNTHNLLKKCDYKEKEKWDTG